MSFQQLEYIVAVDECRSFSRAAERCFVTQPTLSAMVQKLEDELNIVIFDRSRKPVETTKSGKEVVVRARKILAEKEALYQYARELHERLDGELTIAIIPTLAPYLLPLFVGPFLRLYPGVKLIVHEINTETTIRKIKSGEVEIGILALPLHESELEEFPLFEEPFYVYQSPGEVQHLKKFLTPKDLDVSRLWLLEEGHCLRSQVVQLCNMREDSGRHSHLSYEAGSIESLVQLVDNYEGITIVPHLAVARVTALRRGHLYAFAAPKPCRTIGLVTIAHYPRKKLRAALMQVIQETVQPIIQSGYFE